MVTANAAKYLFAACLCASVVDLFVVDLVIAPLALEPTAAVTAVTPAMTPAATLAPAGGAAAGAATTLTPAAAVATTSLLLPAIVRAGSYPPGVVARFDSDQAVGSSDDLAALAKAMLADPKTRIVLEGHADPTGDRSHNRTLSLDRAKWAQGRLVDAGVAAARIEVIGHGAERLLSEGDDDAAVASNRRVEFRWLPSSPSDEEGNK
jgi:peptidoglycan-associated lipoprotein